MELRVLKYFLMIAREENISKSGTKTECSTNLFIKTAYADGRRTRVKLFKHLKHSISLTEGGILLKQRAQEIINIEEKIRRFVAQ